MLRFVFSSTIFIFCLITAFPFTFAQECQKTDAKEVNIEKIKAPKDKDYKDWQKFETKYFTFFAPNELKQKYNKCIDSAFCDDFVAEDLILRVDIHVDAGRPSFEKEYSSYCEKFAWIDKAFAWLWSFENESEYKYTSGVLFKFRENRNLVVQMGLHSKGKNIKEIGEKIFKSVRFKGHRT